MIFKCYLRWVYWGATNATWVGLNPVVGKIRLLVKEILCVFYLFYLLQTFLPNCHTWHCLTFGLLLSARPYEECFWFFPLAKTCHSSWRSASREGNETSSSRVNIIWPGVMYCWGPSAIYFRVVPLLKGGIRLALPQEGLHKHTIASQNTQACTTNLHLTYTLVVNRTLHTLTFKLYLSIFNTVVLVRKLYFRKDDIIKFYVVYIQKQNIHTCTHNKSSYFKANIQHDHLFVE